jgi:hypothetical protein
VLVPYRGNAPKAVSKDAKYAVVHEKGEMVVRLIYRLNEKERALLTTASHPELVAMVNSVKEEKNGQPGGPFYINEYQMVIVPTAQDGYFYAGSYTPPLEFEFEGMTISPAAPADLKVGDEWRGPHVGIPYVLTADGRDIRYEAEVRPRVIRRERLRDVVGASRAAQLAKRLGQHKPGGGRLYINEAREFFSPVESDGRWIYIYLGPLGADGWFPPPTV